MPVEHKDACAFHEQSPLQCRCCTLLLELEVDCPQHYPEKQVDGKSAEESLKIEAERCTMAHDVRKQQGEDEPPDKAERKSPEECATDRDHPLPLEHAKDKTKHPPQHEKQKKASELTDGRVCNGDPKPV